MADGSNTHTEYILSWAEGFGKVSCGDYLFDITIRPVLPFEYDALYFETATGMYIKFLNGERVTLSPEEMAACREYCNGYVDGQDCPGQAFETESGLFRGSMTRGEAEISGYSWILKESPDHPVSKLVDGEWVRIAATIRSDGSYALMPASVCDACVLFLSAVEWEAFPKPSRSSEKWDFVSESWKDPRTLDTAKDGADSWIRESFSPKRREVMGNAPYRETVWWVEQMKEAQAYRANSDAETPFLDGMLEAFAGHEATALITKDELVNSILKYAETDYLKRNGAVHGEMQARIIELRQAEKLEEVDALTDMHAEQEKIRPINFRVSFYEEGGVPVARAMRNSNG